MSISQPITEDEILRLLTINQSSVVTDPRSSQRLARSSSFKTDRSASIPDDQPSWKQLITDSNTALSYDLVEIKQRYPKKAIGLFHLYWHIHSSASKNLVKTVKIIDMSRGDEVVVPRETELKIF